MAKFRNEMTNDEKLAVAALGTDSNFNMVNMRENSIDVLVEKEKAAKMNEQLEKFQEQMDKSHEEMKKSQDAIEYDINTAEIKPLFSRIIFTPFKSNPFQKLVTEGNIIIDTGGYNPHIDKNPITGKNEEMDQFIRTGCVQEVGPECKYIKPGDVIFYRKDTAVPVPFFKQGFYSLDEHQVISIVNEKLTERFENCK